MLRLIIQIVNFRNNCSRQYSLGSIVQPWICLTYPFTLLFINYVIFNFAEINIFLQNLKDVFFIVLPMVDKTFKKLFKGVIFYYQQKLCLLMVTVRSPYVQLIVGSNPCLVK